MRRFFTLIVLLSSIVAVFGQTLNVSVGNITYSVPAQQAGEMKYISGTQLQIMGKVFNVADVNRIYVDDRQVVDNSVDINYSGTNATVRVAGNIMQYVTVKIRGAHVTILQKSNLATELKYTLRGNSTNGSFYMDGKYKATLVFDGLTLNNPDSAAVNIRNGKRIGVILNDGTVNTLTDGAKGTQKACFAVKGHTEFDGLGTLNITGNTKHGFWGKEYVQLKKGTGTINILGSKGDGFNVNQCYQQNGGTVTIKNVTDDGIQVNIEDDDTPGGGGGDDDDDDGGDDGGGGGGGGDDIIIIVESPARKKMNKTFGATIENNGDVHINGGRIQISVTGQGAKGIKAVGTLLVTNEKSEPVINITTSGGVLVQATNDYSSSACMKSDKAIIINAGQLTLTSTGQGGRAMVCEDRIDINGGEIKARAEGSNYGSGGGRWGSSANSKNAKCIKAKGDLNISGGNVNAYAKSHEAIESKKIMTISGGVVYGQSTDDAINSKGDMYIKGGIVYGYSTGNDGLDANGHMYIQGGVAIGLGAGSMESGIDIDERHNIMISGGEVFGIGGRIDARFGTCTQAYGTTSSTSLSGNYLVLYSNSTGPIYAIKLPKTSYTGSILCSSASMRKGYSYSIACVSSVTGTESNGFIAKPTASGLSARVNITAK